MVLINSSLLTVTLFCSVIKILVYNDTKYSVSFHEAITEFDCIYIYIASEVVTTRKTPRCLLYSVALRTYNYNFFNKRHTLYNEQHVSTSRFVFMVSTNLKIDKYLCSSAIRLYVNDPRLTAAECSCTMICEKWWRKWWVDDDDDDDGDDDDMMKGDVQLRQSWYDAGENSTDTVLICYINYRISQKSLCTFTRSCIVLKVGKPHTCHVTVGATCSACCNRKHCTFTLT